MAQPNADATPAYPKSFAALLAESAGYPADEWRPRIAWLRTPRDGSDAFLTVAAETLLRPADDPLAKIVRERPQGQDRAGRRRAARDRYAPDAAHHAHRDEKMHGVTIHAHIAAQMVDGRSIGQLETNSMALRLALAGGDGDRLPGGLALPHEAAGPAGERRRQRGDHRR